MFRYSSCDLIIGQSQIWRSTWRKYATNWYCMHQCSIIVYELCKLKSNYLGIRNTHDPREYSIKLLSVCLTSWMIYNSLDKRIVLRVGKWQKGFIMHFLLSPPIFCVSFGRSKYDMWRSRLMSNYGGFHLII